MRSLIAKGGLVVAAVAASWLSVVLSKIVNFYQQDVSLVQGIGIKLGITQAPALMGTGLVMSAAQTAGVIMIGIGIYWVATTSWKKGQPKSNLGLAIETAATEAAVDRFRFQSN